MFRKNKIKPNVSTLLSLPSDEEPLVSSQAKIEIVLDGDEEDIVNELNSEPSSAISDLDTRLRNRKKGSVFLDTNDYNSSSENEAANSYADLYKRQNSKQTKVSILNLDDMSDEGYNEFGSERDQFYPKVDEIQDIKQCRAIEQQKLNTEKTGFYGNPASASIKYNKKAYVRLMNSANKGVLNKVLGQGCEKNSLDLEMQDEVGFELDDGKLALNDSERKAAAQKLESEMKAALVDEDFYDDVWESNQLKKQSNSNAIILQKPLPTRFRYKDCSLSLQELAVSLLPSDVQPDSTTNTLLNQLDIIESEHSSLKLSKDKIILELKKLL